MKLGHEKYADRTKDKAALRGEKLKEYEKKASLDAVETEISPFIDLAEYKAKIEQLDKLLGTTTHFPADTAKAGHTEAAVHKTEESHAPAAANDDHEHGKAA